MRVDSDWVTPLRISPQTCTGCFRSTFLFLLRIDGLDVVRRSADVQHDRLIVTLVSRFTLDLFISVWIVLGSRSSFWWGLCYSSLEETWTVFESSGEFRVDCAYLILHLQCGGGRFHGVQQIVGNGSGGSFLRSFGPAAGKFLGLALDLRSDRLYDLAPDIPDVMGLRALRLSAAILKVMSVPDSR